jgi:methylmalonyl-CoA mutase N-terminal domain/subunit
VRASRSQSAVTERLAALERAARDGSNLMPAILDAAEAYATVGEASGTLRTVFGEYRDDA